jgi:hypothetical protein
MQLKSRFAQKDANFLYELSYWQLLKQQNCTNPQTCSYTLIKRHGYTLLLVRLGLIILHYMPNALRNLLLARNLTREAHYYYSYYYYYYYYYYHHHHHYRPPLWSSGQTSWLQIRRPGFDSRHYQKKIVGLERRPLSLVSTTEELLDRKVAAPV